MKRFLTKIWVPLVLVTLAGIQSFGIDASRAVGLKRLADSLIINQLPDTTAVRDSLLQPDSTGQDQVTTDSTIKLILSAKDTLKVPDSLKETDPFKYKYYI